MRAVVQRVSSASVVVDDQVVGCCGDGFLVLVAAHKSDTEFDAKWMADRIAGLRIMADGDGKMNLALRDVPYSGEPQVLAISNFTLYGDANKNRRPSFTEAAAFDEGKGFFDAFVEELRAVGIEVSTGVFGAMMEVSLVNDGPVTIILDSKADR